MPLQAAIREAVESGVKGMRRDVSNALAQYVATSTPTGDDLQYVQFWLDLLDQLLEDAQASSCTDPGIEKEPVVSVPQAINKFLETMQPGDEFSTNEALTYCLQNVRLSTSQLRRHPSTGRRALDQNVNVALGILFKENKLDRVTRGQYKVIATD